MLSKKNSSLASLEDSELAKIKIKGTKFDIFNSFVSGLMKTETHS